MLNREQIKTKLKDANIRKVSRSSGVSHQVILRLMKGGGISLDSMEKLSDYLESGDAQNKND